MHLQILFVALGSMILFGVALGWVIRVEQLRVVFEPRLKAISLVTSNVDSIVVSLGRPRLHRKALPVMWLSRLDNALAAAGNRIVLAHLVASAIIASAVIGFAAAVTLSRPAVS